MGLADLTCPVCSADFALGGDERDGEEVFCSYCGAPCKLLGDPYSEDCDIEDDM